MSTDVHEDGIAVVHCDPFTGIVLDPNPPFDKYNIKPNSGRIPFDSRESAVQYCNSIVEQFPHLECHVIGLPDGDGYMLTDPSWIERESERRLALQREHVENQRAENRLFWRRLKLVLIVVAVILLVLWLRG